MFFTSRVQPGTPPMSPRSGCLMRMRSALGWPARRSPASTATSARAPFAWLAFAIDIPLLGEAVDNGCQRLDERPVTVSVVHQQRPVSGHANNNDAKQVLCLLA